MKAIVTKFLPATNFKGSRIKADDGDGNTITISNDQSLSWINGENHAKAAIALCRKMGWKGKLIRGCAAKFWVHVFAEGDSVDLDLGIPARR